MRTIDIKIVAPDNADLHALIGRLDEEMGKLYPAEGIFGVDFSDPAVAEMTFCVAYVGGTPAGCGAFKPLGGGEAELKRFFVEPSFRGRGIASLVLDSVEQRPARPAFRS